MKPHHLLPVVVLALACAGVAPAATLRPSNVSMAVDCNFKLQVTPTLDGQTLQLESTEPIFSHPCSNNGIVLSNRGKGAADRTFTFDCLHLGTIRGSSRGKGLQIKGPGLVVMSCDVDGFSNGVVVSDDGAEVDDTIVQNSTRDGFSVKDPVNPNSDKFLGTSLFGNQSLNNRGFGFKMKGNGFDLEGGNFVSNLALGNHSGGFSVVGDGNVLSGNDAISNGGAGVMILGKSCCLPNSFDTARALNNAQAGIVYAGRDQGTTCSAAGCLPLGIDLSAQGAIFASGNASICPAGTTTAKPIPGQICIASKTCSTGELDKCL